MQHDQWRPSATISTLQQRASLLRCIRHYFDMQKVMEVETPIISTHATVDVFIESFEVHFAPIGDPHSYTYYLHTSPEFAMKRLLAAGSGDIYSLGKVFRNGEAGSRHNPEFTMLEWYRVGMNQQQMMDDVAQLLMSVCDFQERQRYSYGELFESYFGINPHRATEIMLQELMAEHVDANLTELDRADCLDLLFSNCIEPMLVQKQGVQKAALYGYFVYDYPACMAALAKITVNSDGDQVAERFELFINGVEVANGYHELQCSEEQQQRFEHELEKRSAKGAKRYPYDANLVAALHYGLPECAGVAIGVDRLMMLICQTQEIGDVVAFNFARA